MPNNLIDGNVVPFACPGDGEARAAGEVGGQRRRFGFCIGGDPSGDPSGVLSRFKRRMDDRMIYDSCWGHYGSLEFHTTYSFSF